MTETPNAPTPAEAAKLLLWLRDMGADEAVADQPINRFLEKPPAARPVQAPVSVAFVPKAAAPPITTPLQDTELVAHIAAAPDLQALGELLNQFDAHPLKKTASRHCLHGGAAEARVLIISDRPRAEEDRTGQVFAAKHEVLSERMLEAIGLRGLADDEAREQVALASFIPWRPPGNRSPTDIECQMAVPVIRRAIQLIRPRIILALGALPGEWLAGAPASITSQRGKWMAVDGIPMISTFHPETLLKSPASKRLAWHDLLALREKLDAMP